jgi:hypothetical protein
LLLSSQALCLERSTFDQAGAQACASSAQWRAAPSAKSKKRGIFDSPPFQNFGESAYSLEGTVVLVVVVLVVVVLAVPSVAGAEVEVAEVALVVVEVLLSSAKLAVDSRARAAAAISVFFMGISLMSVLTRRFGSSLIWPDAGSKQESSPESASASPG